MTEISFFHARLFLFLKMCGLASADYVHGLFRLREMYKRIKRNDFDANYRPESLHESSRLAEKTRIVVMTTKEPEVLGSCASRYRARLFCGRRRFLSCFLRNFLEW